MMLVLFTDGHGFCLLLVSLQCDGERFLASGQTGWRTVRFGFFKKFFEQSDCLWWMLLRDGVTGVAFAVQPRLEAWAGDSG